ncbi:MAG: serpin family protein [Oscillospiraceae bacterium]|nr:serpin family protein [Oscillospiraceae bacterium]
MKRLIALVLAAVIMLSLVGCTQTGPQGDLMQGIKAYRAQPPQDKQSTANALTDFSAQLFANCAGQENIMVSPVSVLYALGMTANGADSHTLAEFESLFGADINEVNCWLKMYKDSLKNGLHMANAIWFRENGFTAREEFLQTNATYYNAGAYSAPFDDSTVKDINSFVKENTGGQIDKIIDRIEPSTVMFLLNAISFDSQWAVKYRETQINEDRFAKYDGTQQIVSMMFSEEDIHLQDENTNGFMKDYKGGNYRFVALLPDEDVDIIEYARSLTGEKLTNLLNNPTGRKASVMMPEFKTEYFVQLADILPAMGLETAFDPYAADFTNLGTADENLYISSVLHKTTITVDRAGTKAAAVTMVSADEAAAEPVEDIPARVHLDRPFIYMIVDTEHSLPLFIGMVLEVTE